MKELGFDEKKMTGIFFGEDKNENTVELKIKNFKDICSYYKNQKYEVDVFYGDKKSAISI